MFILMFFSVLVITTTLYFLFSSHDRLFIKSANRKIKENIRIVRNIIPPSIINDQTYSFIDTKYSNMKFKQAIRSNDYVSNYIKSKGIWPECQDIYNIYQSGKKDGVFLDFGANIGSCSFLFAQSGINVYAFEPLHNNLFLFSLTTFTNANYSKYITIYPYALGKKEKNQRMKIVKNNWGYSSLYYQHNDYNENVFVKKLDEFDKLIPSNISMIKIDVEGSEYDLLEGGKIFFLNHNIEFIHMEVECGKKDQNGKYEIEKMFAILNKMGFDVIKKFNCSRSTKSNIVAKYSNRY